MRVERAQANAMILAKYLEQHPQIEWVRYPGLESHPQYDLGRSQMSGPGALISFGVKGGIQAGRTVLDNLELITLAVSLGGVESLIQHPASMTHAGVPREAREKAGISDGLIRFSVGCENVEDLQAELSRVLDLL